MSVHRPMLHTEQHHTQSKTTQRTSANTPHSTQALRETQTSRPLHLDDDRAEDEDVDLDLDVCDVQRERDEYGVDDYGDTIDNTDSRDRTGTQRDGRLSASTAAQVTAHSHPFSMKLEKDIDF